MSQTLEDFGTRVQMIQGSDDYPGNPDAFALGVVRRSEDDTVLDVRFPTVNYRENYGSAAVFWEAFNQFGLGPEILRQLRDETFTAFRGDGKVHANIDAVEIAFATVVNQWDLTPELIWIQDLQQPATSTQDVWLRLHLLSTLKVQPNSINLDGIFALLPNIAWTNQGPVLAEELEQKRWTSIVNGQELTVRSVDKFPPLLDYVVPAGVRIADASRVRLGAHLSPGTTVMHEGFVNFNAGTLGTSMVEGRISQGVVVGNGSDIGGGASIMGTLSGGGTHKVSIGERSLLGANAGIGISIGDDVIVEAGLYLTAGTKVALSGELVEKLGYKAKDTIVTARMLNGISGVIFRRNSQTGAAEALPNTKGTPKLNAMLHAN